MRAITRPAGSLGDFLASSRGAWLALDSLLYFHTLSGLTGYFIWDDPSAEELEILSKIVDASLDLEPHPSMVDGRQVRAAPARFFEHMVRYFPERRERLARAVERVALVRPPGVAGASAAGFFKVVQAPYPVDSFEELEPALQWLGQADSGELARELEDLLAGARGVPALVHRLRSQIEQSLVAPKIEELAPRLGMSERTLHRRLTELGTSFGDEVSRMRVEAAKALLRDTDTSLTRIAIDVGCPSLSSFSVLFRKWVGTTPTAYRASARSK